MNTEGAASSIRTVLLVEDDRGLRESLATVLSYEGHTILQAESAEDAAGLVAAHQPDLIVLDVNLPGQDGLGFLRDLRSTGDGRQVLLLTARHEVADRVAGLDAGADDYLPKPFALDELLARVRAMLRRVPAIDSAPPTPAAPGGGSAESRTVGSVVVEPGARRVTVEGVEVDLTKLEYDLLDLLVTHLDQVLTRSVIHERVWGYDDDYSSNTLEVAVSSLRRKIERGAGPRVIHTVRGVGYVARVPSGGGASA
ncbi:MAG: response regulator transcription factor [Actinomycetota bacterium]